MKMMFHIRYIGRKEVKIVKYCGVMGGGALGGAKILQKVMPTPSVIKIVIKYCGVSGRGGGIGGGAKILQK